MVTILAFLLGGNLFFAARNIVNKTYRLLPLNLAGAAFSVIGLANCIR